MAAATTTERKTSQPVIEPSIWKRFSPRGECPISIASSFLLHVGVLALIIAWILWNLGDLGNTSSRPPEMDIVEIEGEGGGLGGKSMGSGALDTGIPGRREGAENVKEMKRNQPGALIPKDSELAKLPNLELDPPPAQPDETPPVKDGNPWYELDVQRKLNEKMLDQENKKQVGQVGAGMKNGDTNAAPGGAGGLKGPGVGKNKAGKEGKGQSLTGQILNTQRRRELRWNIRVASTDADVHLKKLQALKAILIVPLQSQPGYALKFDLSKPTIGAGEKVRAEDDFGKVRWSSKGELSPIAAASLAKALKLPEVPSFTVIYLPKSIEDAMAERELNFMGRQEHEILQTIWDVRQRDGVYENEPYIVQQTPRGAK
jgi:hypothetical protein